VLPPCSSTGAHARRARRGRQWHGSMARGDPNLVWVEGFTSPMRLADIIKPPLGYGLASKPSAPARALWAGPEPEPPPPPERAVRGDDAVMLAPVRARAPAGPSCLAGHRVIAGSLGPSQVARVSGRRLLYVHELAGAPLPAPLTRRGWWTRRRPRRASAPLRTRSRARRWLRGCRSAPSHQLSTSSAARPPAPRGCAPLPGHQRHPQGHFRCPVSALLNPACGVQAPAKKRAARRPSAPAARPLPPADSARLLTRADGGPERPGVPPAAHGAPASKKRHAVDGADAPDAGRPPAAKRARPPPAAGAAQHAAAPAALAQTCCQPLADPLPLCEAAVAAEGAAFLAEVQAARGLRDTSAPAWRAGPGLAAPPLPHGLGQHGFPAEEAEEDILSLLEVRTALPCIWRSRPRAPASRSLLQLPAVGTARCLWHWSVQNRQALLAAHW